MRSHAPPVRPPQDRVLGMTMIETMIVVVLVAMLVTGSVPGFGRILSNHRASSAVNDFVHAIALARGEAMKRGRRVYLAPVGAHWRDGWAVFVDRDDDRVFDAPDGSTGDELITRHDALPASITIVNPTTPGREPFTDLGSPQRTYIAFDGHGYPRQRNGGYNIGSLVVTDRSGGATTIRTICLAAYGRVRVVADRTACS